ncbi:MAG TPA: DNA translocase FtsK 4TM domain-containing protein, partial [Acidimicrobiales bacterium]
MATKQQTRSSKRSRAGASSRSRGKASTRGTSRTTAASRTPSGPLGHGVRQAFDGHGHDAWGLVAIVTAIVAGLGIYSNLAGPVGHGLAVGIGAGVGVVAWLVPPALLALGILAIRGPRVEGEPPSFVRPAVGGILILVALCGLLQLTRGRPEWGDPLDDFVHAGGALGALVGGTLTRLIGVWGAALLLVALAVLGLLVLTRTSVRAAAGRTASGVQPARSAVAKVFAPLFRIESTEVSPEIDLRDENAAPKRKRAPKAGVDPESLAVVVAGESDARPSEPGPVPEPESESEPTEVEQLEIGLGPAAERSAWKLPPSKLLGRSETQAVDRMAVEERGRALEGALAEHGVETRLVGMVVGPTVTRYELELAPGVKVARVTSLHKDIAYAMASPDVRILAPIPGRQAIGVEVPNASRQVVALGDILSSEEARRAKHPLEVAVGRDINGRAILANLATMPHVLIAGATGAGKSSCINSLITSVLMRSTPDQVRMILVDPKRVELGQYNKLPHLLTQVVTNPKKAANALTWAVREMERRYDLLSEVGVRDITGYNAAFDRGDLVAAGEEQGIEYQRLPFILIVVDELNDLMMVAAR